MPIAAVMPMAAMSMRTTHQTSMRRARNRRPLVTARDLSACFSIFSGVCEKCGAKVVVRTPKMPPRVLVMRSLMSATRYWQLDRNQFPVYWVSSMAREVPKPNSTALQGRIRSSRTA